ncbi:MAG: DUF4277 domain-containing protein [Nodosilinea sp. WJT8-NPBG4]|nr:DUF4277 domain-containing protein [Nodosilinea sp. WJT8-NPBG4]
MSIFWGRIDCCGFPCCKVVAFGFNKKLLGGGITAAHLNDDRLGRVLDQLFEYGTSLFFLNVAMQAVSRFGVSVSSWFNPQLSSLWQSSRYQRAAVFSRSQA